MHCLRYGILVASIAFAAISSADDAKEAAIKRDRNRIQGTWRITALEINGTTAQQSDMDKFKVVNEDNGKWSLRSEGKIIGEGDSVIDPTKKPKTIDFTPSSGGAQGQQFQGIYELGAKKRRLCFAPAGKGRPTEFSSTLENQHILVTFQRVKEQ